MVGVEFIIIFYSIILFFLLILFGLITVQAKKRINDLEEIMSRFQNKK